MKKLLALLLLLAACDDAHPTASEAVMYFETRPVDGARAVLTPRFDGGMGGLTVSGTIGTPCQEQPVYGELQGAGAGIVLRVRVLPAGTCLPALDYVEYTARIAGLTEGVYRVTVVYEGEWHEPMEAGTARVRVQ